MTFSSLANGVVFALIGIVIYAVALRVVVGIVFPHLWERAEEQGSVPAAIVVAGLALGLAWIVAAAVH
jgi:uncharacterized membrane protein YjfL (UPF0719 family)